MASKPPVNRPAGIGDRQQRPHPRSREAEAYRRLYRNPRWCGAHGIRKQAFLRDLYTCQRCGCIVVEGNRHHTRAAVANHKRAHKGKEALFFDLGNVETVCKACHDTLVQREEARGYTIGADADGRPIDPNHPWNFNQTISTPATDCALMSNGRGRDHGSEIEGVGS